MVGIFIDPEGEGYNAWNVEIIPAGAWDPFANMPPADVTFEGVWDNVDACGPLDFGGVYDFGSFRFDPVDWSMIVVDFALDIPDVPLSTILNLEIEPMFTMVDAMSGQLPVSLEVPWC